MTFLTNHNGVRYELEPVTDLAKAVVDYVCIDDFCPLCDCHSSSGHSTTCPLVKEWLDHNRITVSTEPALTPMEQMCCIVDTTTAPAIMERAAKRDRLAMILEQNAKRVSEGGNDIGRQVESCSANGPYMG